MTELQTKLLELMVELDEICKKHDIEYMLFAGSSLGAERHGGFIPWDDDADIIMTLPNYEKLLSVIDGELKEGRAFDALETDPNYLLTYARYVNTDTTAIQRHTVFGGCHPGVKVDVFAVVPTFDDDERMLEHRDDILAFAETICTTGRMITYRPEGFYQRYLADREACEMEGREQYVNNRLEELKTRAVSDEKPNRYILFSGMASNTKVYDAKIFDAVKYVKFEDTELPISVNNTLFSEQHLGRDWMALPVDVAEPKHLFLEDFGRPYTYYLDKAAKTMDLKKCKKVAVQKKTMNLIEKEIFRDVLKNSQEIRNAKVGSDTAKALEGLRTAEEPKAKLAEALALVEPYVHAQLSRSSRTHGLVIDTKEEDIKDLLAILIKAGRYYDAEAIIRMRMKARGKDHPGSKAVAEELATCEAMRKIETAVFVDVDHDKAKALIEKLGGEKDSVTALVATALGALASYDTESIMRSEIDLRAALSSYGEIGELMAARGICLERLGMKDQAREMFEGAMKNIRNGFLLQALVNRGVDINMLFEESKKREAAIPKVKVSDVIKGKGDRDAIECAKKAGCLSLSKRMRYLKYSSWIRKEKKPVDKAYKKYEDQLFGLKED